MNKPSTVRLSDSYSQGSRAVDMRQMRRKLQRSRKRMLIRYSSRLILIVQSLLVSKNRWCSMSSVRVYNWDRLEQFDALWRSWAKYPGVRKICDADGRHSSGEAHLKVEAHDDAGLRTCQVASPQLNVNARELRM